MMKGLLFGLMSISFSSSIKISIHILNSSCFNLIPISKCSLQTWKCDATNCEWVTGSSESRMSEKETWLKEWVKVNQVFDRGERESTEVKLVAESESWRREKREKYVWITLEKMNAVFFLLHCCYSLHFSPSPCLSSISLFLCLLSLFFAYWWKYWLFWYWFQESTNN